MPQTSHLYESGMGLRHRFALRLTSVNVGNVFKAGLDKHLNYIPRAQTVSNYYRMSTIIVTWSVALPIVVVFKTCIVGHFELQLYS